jgi:hypothetical protein
MAGNMASEKRVRRISDDFPDFVRFRRDFIGITVHGSPKSLLRTCWEQKSYC